MSTKTMRLPPRRVQNPTGSNKRKDRDGFDLPKPSTPKSLKPAAPPSSSASALASASASKVGSSSKPAGPKTPNNMLLAGYLASEYLTKGTLFGKAPQPTPAELMLPPPQKGAEAQWRKAKELAAQKNGAESKEEKYERYVEVANLLKNDRVHIPGIVNPSQLAQFLQL